jgi:CPA1 family monovalent cation:H+ antiporter
VTLAMSLAGVRGSVTLAGVLTFPMMLADGSAFSTRDLCIFLAAAVIILSLTGASIGLPRLLRNLQVPSDGGRMEAEDRARARAAEAAIQAIEKAQHQMAENRPDADLYIEIGTRLMDVYRRRLSRQELTGEAREEIRKADRIEKELRLVALRAERDELFRLARSREVGDDVLRRLVREVDLYDAQQRVSA